MVEQMPAIERGLDLGTNSVYPEDDSIVFASLCNGVQTATDGNCLIDRRLQQNLCCGKSCRVK